MSIYGTRGTIRFLVEGVDPRVADQLGLVDPEETCTGFADDESDERRTVYGVWVRVWVQEVPGHIDDTGPMWDFLPPPSGDEETPRAIVLVLDWTPKGSSRNGQEYGAPKLTIPWPYWRKRGFDERWLILEEWVERETRTHEEELLREFAGAPAADPPVRDVLARIREATGLLIEVEDEKLPEAIGNKVTGLSDLVRAVQAENAELRKRLADLTESKGAAAP